MIKEQEEEHLQSAGVMLLLAFIVGIFGGFGSIVFKATIAFFHNLLFFGTLGLRYNTDAYIAPSPWGALVILVPVVGGLMVTWITQTLAPEARGHGVPEVMNAIYYKAGRIRPVVVVAKAIASAISIGTGGSVGREGPIIQIGSAFGSGIGQLVKMPTRQRVILIAAGAAAGIAATFNAPVGGLAFAIELLLVSISARTVTLVAVATVTATYIGRLYSGLAPSFNVPRIALFEDHIFRLYSLLLCIPLGIIAGGASAVFIRSIYVAEDFFAARLKNYYLRHIMGMLCVGTMLYLFLLSTGRYYVGGVGYATILGILQGSLSNPGFLALLFVAKLLATDLTIGSGASGGVFSPSLFLGATLGAAFGNCIEHFFPGSGFSNPVMYTIAGMAAMVGGSTGAVLTAIIMTFEQTRDYGVMLPIILTVSLAHMTRVSLCPESIYTLKLMRRGNHVPQGLQAATFARSHAKQIMSSDFQVIEMKDFSQWQVARKPGRDPRYTIVAREGAIFGIVSDELLYLLQDENPEKVLATNMLLVTGTAKWPVIIRGMRQKKTEAVLVMSHSKSKSKADLVGIITPRELIRHAGTDAELMD